MVGAGPSRRDRRRRRWVSALAVFVVALLAVVVSLQLTHRQAANAGNCRQVTLEVSSSTEKSALLQSLATGYDANRRTLDGVTYCPQVHVLGLTSGAAEQAIAAGWTKSDRITGGKPVPDVWTPSTSMWAALARYQGATVVPAPAPSGDPYPVLARSAVVVVLPEAKASRLRQGLDAAGQLFDWSMLPMDGASWGQPGTVLRYGDQAWGRFWFRKDNPMDSTSGLSATIATYDAAYRFAVGGTPQGDIPADALRDPRLIPFVRQVEDGIPPSGYSPDGTQMMRDLAIEDQTVPGWSGTSAVVVQEQLAYLYNTHQLGGNAPDTAPKQPLAVVYPRSGVHMMDHPYITLDGLSEDKQRIAEDFRRYLSTQRDGWSRYGFRDPSGTPLPGLSSSLPGLVDDPQPRLPYPSGAGVQAILDSWKALRKKANLVVLMDVSGSMNDKLPDGRRKIEAARDALIAGIERTLTGGDRIEVRAFSGSAADPPERTFRVVYRLGQVGDRQALENAIRGGLGLGTDTPLYDNIAMAHRYLVDNLEPDAVNAVIVLTDGVDDYRHEPLQALLDTLSGSPVPVYCIAFGADPGLLGSQSVLTDIARASGGHGQEFDATVNGTDTIDNAFAKALSVA